MVGTVGRLCAASLLALSLGGCIAVGKFDRRADTLTEQVGVVQNRSVLLNLARASRNEPLYFMALNQLSSGGTTDARFTPPPFFLGPYAILSKIPTDRIAQFDTNGTTFLDNTTTMSFQMSLLGAKDFYNGLMGPITLEDVDLLLHQGISRELIFYLVIDKATVSYTDDGGDPVRESDPRKVHTLVVYNSPSANPADRLTHENMGRSPGLGDLKSYWLFQYLIMQAMKHGLTTETYETQEATADASDSTTPGADGKPKAGGKKPASKVVAALCYDRALVKDADALAEIDAKSFCGRAHHDAPTTTGTSAPLAVTLHDPGFLKDKKLDIEVSTRSIYEIFYALGRMIHSDSNVTMLDFGLPAEKVDEEPLVNIRAEAQPGLSLPPGDCFAVLRHDKRIFCAPADGPGSDNTKRIFGILNALLALKQSVSDQPVTQTVRITQ